jgi:hypothetical protein
MKTKNFANFDIKTVQSLLPALQEEIGNLEGILGRLLELDNLELHIEVDTSFGDPVVYVVYPRKDGVSVVAEYAYLDEIIIGKYKSWARISNDQVSEAEFEKEVPLKDLFFDKQVAQTECDLRNSELEDEQ